MVQKLCVGKKWIPPGLLILRLFENFVFFGDFLKNLAIMGSVKFHINSFQFQFISINFDSFQFISIHLLKAWSYFLTCTNVSIEMYWYGTSHCPIMPYIYAQFIFLKLITKAFWIYISIFYFCWGTIEIFYFHFVYQPIWSKMVQLQNRIFKKIKESQRNKLFRGITKVDKNL